MMYLVYILKCSDNTYYTGSTNDLDRRLKQHNSLKAGAHYTKIRRPVTLAYSEECVDISSARKRECAVKKMTRIQKEELVISWLNS